MLCWFLVVFLFCPAVPPVSCKTFQFQIDISILLMVSRDEICSAVGNETELTDSGLVFSVADVEIVFSVCWTDA